MPIINNITSRLRAKGVTLSALASELGVSTGTVGGVVSGKSMSYPVQTAIAARLDTTVEALWPGQVRLRRNRAQIEAGVTTPGETHGEAVTERRAEKIMSLLSTFPDEMMVGFTIRTGCGDIYIDKDEAASFAKLTEKVLRKRLANNEKNRQRRK